ncbi:MAG TPA: hypothetical protein PK760_09535, partial [Flavobacteriales bacterium]|nr:hypothetical protein [Flavobacteriales bacterium]
MTFLKQALPAALAFAVSTSVFAQQERQFSLRWPSLKVATGQVAKSSGSVVRTEQAQTSEGLAFPNAALDMDRNGLPVFTKVLSLRMGTTGVSAFVRDARYAALTVGEKRAWPALDRAGAEPLVTSHLSWYRKQPQAVISVEPFRRNGTTGEIEKLVDFRIDVVETVGPSAGGRPKDYPAQSRMAQGEWYRFTVAKDGVYKLTYDFLSGMGVNLNSLQSSNINIYGNHFGLLPFVNNVNRPTDVIPNNIEVVDGGDGVFGQGDYILFYASGAQRWDLASGDTLIKHTKNVYTDSASYFVGIDVEAPFRVTPSDLTTDAPSHTVTSFRDRQVIDRDLTNLVKSGRTWFGETYDNTLTYTYNFDTPNLVNGEPIVLEFDGAARTYNSGTITNYSSFTITSGGFNSTISIAGIASVSTGPQARLAHQNMSWSSGSNSIPVTVTFNKFDPVTSVGWLNYLRVNCTRHLTMSGDQLAFRDLASVGTGNISEFVLEQAQSVQRIWEITDP